MQVKINANINSRPQFTALQGIKYRGEVFQNSAMAQKEVLKILDNEKIQTLFKKYDGEIIFISSKGINGSFARCDVRIFNKFKDVCSKIKQEFVEKAKISNISADIFENARFDECFEEGCTNFVSSAAIRIDSDDKKLCERLIYYINEDISDDKWQRYNNKLVRHLERQDYHIRSIFNRILERNSLKK